MSYKCELVVLKAQKTLCIKTRSDVAILPEVIGKTYYALTQYMGKVGVNPSGIPYVGYFNMDMTDLDLEIGWPVAADVPEEGDIKMGVIPAGKYATTLHKGSYSKMKAAYTALMQYMEENKLEGSGIGYEHYVNDPDKTPEDELETKIFFQIKG